MAKITIGMPVFNDIEFIEESICSILDQDFSDFLLIISDDGSTDGSEAICRRFAEKDSRILYIRQPKNLGISKNMEFLLDRANTEYFMWAADDDLWDKRFVSELIQRLENSKDCVSTFCDYYHIDENGLKISNVYRFNYSGDTAFKRLKYFVKNSDDGFGYGVFRTEMIRGVKFPIWFWPNRRSAYNNIFPSLTFYLAKGDYVHISQPYFYKRVKTENRVHHVISGQGNAIKETFAYILRRLNLVFFSFSMVKKASSLNLALIIFPILFHHWFFKSSFAQVKLASRSFVKNRVFKSVKK